MDVDRCPAQLAWVHRDMGKHDAGEPASDADALEQSCASDGDQIIAIARYEVLSPVKSAYSAKVMTPSEIAENENGVGCGDHLVPSTD